MENSNKKKDIGAIWIKKSKKGDTYASITLNGAKYVAFKNGFKEEGSSQPDYRIYASDDLTKQEPKDDINL